MISNNRLLTEKLRPNTLNACILPKRVRDELEKGLVTNILFTGSPGSGKTTLSRILVKPYEYLHINGSEETGIDVIREKITNFCGTYSLISDEKIKAVHIEECDGLSLEAWKALRAVIEKFADSVRFVMNGNYIEKIPEAIISRFNVIDVNAINNEEEEYLFNEYCKRVTLILKQYKIEFDNVAVAQFVKTYYPDLRSIYNKIESLVNRGITELSSEALAATFDFNDVFELIIGDINPIETYKHITANYSTRVDDVVLAIGDNLANYLKDRKPEALSKLPLLIIEIHDHQRTINQAIDKVVVLLSLIYRLQMILSD